MALLQKSKSFFLKLFTHRCVGCGSKLAYSYKNGSFCKWCLVRMFPYGIRNVGKVSVLAAFSHSGVIRELILRLKFGGEKHIALELVKLSLQTWKKLPSCNDTIVPVPASPERLRERGYNQAALLARAVCSQTGAKYMDILQRQNGVSQIGKSGIERSKNISGKFNLKSNPMLSGTVWLIDDVLTTGATLTEVLSVLSDEGINEVQPFVVCFQKLSNDIIIPY